MGIVVGADALTNVGDTPGTGAGPGVGGEIDCWSEPRTSGSASAGTGSRSAATDSVAGNEPEVASRNHFHPQFHVHCRRIGPGLELRPGHKTERLKDTRERSIR